MTAEAVNLDAVRARLAKILPRLATDSDGEVLATVDAMRRVLESAGLTFNDLPAMLEGKPDPLATVRADIARALDQDNRDYIHAEELDFLRNIARWVRYGREPSAKQAAWLARIIARIDGGA